jgi:hypothetical protein
MLTLINNCIHSNLDKSGHHHIFIPSIEDDILSEKKSSSETSISSSKCKTLQNNFSFNNEVA